MDSVQELWVSVNGFSGKYAISNYGRLKSFSRGAPRLIRPSIKHKGYIVYKLHLDGKIKFFHGGRLVYSHFGESKLEAHMVIDHIDADPSNNHIGNLQQLTQQENLLKGFIEGNNTISRYPGVTFNKKEDVFVARMVVNGRSVMIGRFNSEREAYVAWQDFFRQLHGYNFNTRRVG